MKVGFGSDHAGVELKLTLMEYLKEKGYECVDYGNYDANDRNDDYPVYGRKTRGRQGRRDLRHRRGHLPCSQQGPGNPLLRMLRALFSKNVC